MYFDSRPVDWREDERFMKILQVLGVKAKPEAIFESLAKLKKSAEREQGDTRLINSLKSSALYHSMLGAIGGDEMPEFLKEL